MEPLVSIITVVFNGKKYLEQTIHSVFDQSYKNIEYIIIDGGSTDGTLDIIEKYKRHLSYWVSEPDKGLYDAMNKGIEIANGALIGIINSDDWYELDAVQTMVTAYQREPDCNVFHADRFDILENGDKKLRKFHPSNFKFKYYGMTYNHASMFVTKKEYNLHRYNADLKAFSDYQFVLETYLRNPNHLIYINKAIVNYRLDGISGQMSKSFALKEGFASRKKAGLDLLGNISSFCIRLFVFVVYDNLKRINKPKLLQN